MSSRPDFFLNESSAPGWDGMSHGTGELGHVPRAMSWRPDVFERRPGTSRRCLTAAIDGPRPLPFDLSCGAAFH
ncbi:hypothetical protein [Nannocystis pusilla]|uniref:hypothetical protein n=1 Tax=Nannocystis pusilla TaxID=889268 RepID=UPI003BF29EBD